MSARIFNYTLHAYMIFIFILYDNNLKLAIDKGRIFYVLSYFLLMILEIYFWEISGKNPGVVA